MWKISEGSEVNAKPTCVCIAFQAGDPESLKEPEVSNLSQVSPSQGQTNVKTMNASPEAGLWEFTEEKDSALPY